MSFNYYVDPVEFREAVVAHNTACDEAEARGDPLPAVSDYIGKCFIEIAGGHSTASKFSQYTWRDEMVLDAIEDCLVRIRRFNLKYSDNAFGYFSQICYYAFLRRIEKEKRQQKILNRYVDSLDIDSFVWQEESTGEGAVLLKYLKNLSDSAHKGVQEEENQPAKKKKKRRPKYMDDPARMKPKKEKPLTLDDL